MPGFLFHEGATSTCPHGGQVSTTSANSRVKVSGQPVATVTDSFLITGCAFPLPSGKPQPCIKVVWLVPASRVFVGGQPVILQTSSGLCQSSEQIHQGPPNVTTTQTRVSGI
jgi:uncharacterized Zn-binding protein involved in type VI secretion